MEFKIQLRLLCTLITIINKVFTDRIYLQSAGTEKIGLTNRWDSYTSDSTGLVWHHQVKDKLQSWDVCFSRNSILQTDFYNFTRFLTSVYADITAVIRQCDKVKPQAPKDCGETIAIGAYVTDDDTAFSPPSQNRNFTVLPSKPLTSDFFQWTETFEQSNLGGNKYIQYFFNSKHSCGSLRNFTVYYYICSTLSSLAKFKITLAPVKNNGTKRVIGECVENSKKLTAQPPYLDCTWNGTGTVVGTCICNKGFTNVLSQCKACSSTEFKATDGNAPCDKCGKDSDADVSRTSCPCIKDFYREQGNESEYMAPCFELPAPPQIINQTESSTGVYIEWKNIPANSRKFIIDCFNCPASSIFPIERTSNSVTITGLGAFATYHLELRLENDITKRIGRKSAKKFTIETKPGKPGTIQNLKQTINSDGSVTLQWDPPFAKGSNNPEYIISYGSSSARTSDTEFKIKSDAKTRSYTVKITVEVVVDGERLTGPTYIFEEEVKVKGGVSLDIAIGAGIGAVILVVVIAIAAFCIWRKRNPPYLQVVRMEDGTVKLPGRFYNGSKLYVDPTTYGAVDDAVQDVAFELDRGSLTIGKLLGGGEFADVYKGTLFKNGKSKDVAIKTLKPGASKHDRDDFLSEAAIIGQFSDPNVITLEGVVLKERPNVIVLEYMANGALDKFLQIHDMQFTNLQLLGMARGVASGMKYLSELGFIHRDLAARNILVDEHRTCKVCDFGMSREIKVDETYDTQGGKIPVRWTAPEAIQFKKFTTASDIWSYGIMLWEMMSYGERPYWDWGNYEVLERLNQGYRLPPPMNCPKVIHDLMLNCWNKDRTKRPKMNEIRDQLERWIRSPNLLETTASVVTKTDENLDYTVLQTINKWLGAIGMDRYTDNFLDQGFATPRQILQLTLSDLEGLGIGPIGHRKKIYKAIQNTKSQVDQRHNTAATRKKTFSMSGKKNAGNA